MASGPLTNKLALVALIGLLFITGGWGDSLVFHTDPPGAKVSDHNGSVWAHAGQPVPGLEQKLADYGDDPINLYFEVDGYQTKRVRFIPADLRSGSSAVELIVLQPNTWWGPILARTSQYWYLVVTILVVGIAATHKIVQNRRASKKLEQRLDQIEQTRGQAPQGIGRWRIVERLGGGGMGNVYRAVPKDTMRDEESVALKLMHEELSAQPEFQERFRREVQVSKSLDHPNIARVEDFGEESGMLYLALEFIDGTTLEDHIKGHSLTVERTLELVRPLVDALSYAHDRKIVHRDLKPSNVMLTSRERVVLMDFGLARAVDVTSFTPTGLALGTPSTMAPEQVFGAQPSPAMDQYALGVILYRMLTGRHPFEAEQVEHMMFQHINQDPEALTTYQPELPDDVSRVVLRALAKGPEQRFESVASLFDNLERAAAGHPIDEPPQPPETRTSKKSIPQVEGRGGNEDTLV